MSNVSFKFSAAFAAVALSAALAPAHALTLNTSGLKANATLTLSSEGFSNATAATVVFGSLGNTVRLADATALNSAGKETKVPVFQFPVTKADVAISAKLAITPTSGVSSRSALRLTSDFGDAVLANFAVDFKAKTVYADIFDTLGQTVATKVALYSFVETKPNVISLKGLVLNQTSQIGELVFTPVATDKLSAALGLDEVLKAALSQLKWGIIDVQVTSFARKPKVNDKPLTLADVPPLVIAP